MAPPKSYASNVYMKDFTPAQKQHMRVMQAIARNVINTPMVLKGGTALLLCYGLDRFSEDLDFDCEKRINLETRIKVAVTNLAFVQDIKVAKAGDNVTRYKVIFSGPTEFGLKIETSHREKANPADITVIDGIKVYKLEILAHMKLQALQNRTTSRDLYDVAFIAQKYPSAFKDTIIPLEDLTRDTDSLLARFAPAFESDPLLAHVDVATLILELQECVQKIKSPREDETGGDNEMVL